MYNITIGRFHEDPEAQGVVRPADDSWQLVIDKDGFPHLYLRVKLDPKPGEPDTGLLCVEDLLPAGGKIRDLMQGSYGGEISPEEEEAARAEFLAERETSGIPCPK
jgi:hypothetical protein